jgi:putative RNA 2'-phosphotransferase
MLPKELRERLSKKLAGLLRHYGEKYGLRIDEEGWARIDDVVKALHRIPGYQWVRKEHIMEVVEHDEKGRYETRGGMIRARYGHSIPVSIPYPLLRNPPRKLYHGTVARKLSSIKRKGLIPMKRMYVHLSFTLEDSYETGRRHGPDVVILEVDTECLRRHGLRVYQASPRVALVERVPPDCLSLVNTDSPR